MVIVRFINKVFNSNTYLLYEKQNAVIVDIGDTDELFDFIRTHSLTVKALLLTHTHYDHIYGIRNFMNNYPEMPIFTSQFGEVALNNPQWNFSRYHNDNIAIQSNRVITMIDGQDLRLSPIPVIKVIETPGHDRSCLTFQLEDMLFTGDSYIPGIKTVDTFPKSDKLLAKYWTEELMKMSEKYKIYPGHGDPTG